MDTYSEQWLLSCRALGASDADLLAFGEVALDLADKQPFISLEELLQAGIDQLKAGRLFVPVWGECERWATDIYTSTRGDWVYSSGTIGALRRSSFLFLAVALWQKRLSLHQLSERAMRVSAA